jgi:hypothetical protein
MLQSFDGIFAGNVEEACSQGIGMQHLSDTRYVMVLYPSYCVRNTSSFIHTIISADKLQRRTHWRKEKVLGAAHHVTLGRSVQVAI